MEIYWRLGSFGGVLLLVMLVEYIIPRRSINITRKIRWGRNLGLIFINSLAMKIILPFTAASVALYAEQNYIGLFNIYSVNNILKITLSIILLDLIIYVQHIVFHNLPVLWRLHKIHHIDQAIDVTTGLRFHPVEIIISMLIKCSAVLFLGVPFIAVVIFEIILNASAMFNHGNILLPKTLDKYLRLFIITPDMHRVHHSVIVQETNSNYGFNISLWDRLFGTYIEQPKDGHLEMKIGLEEYQNLEETGIKSLILLPFKK